MLTFKMAVFPVSRTKLNMEAGERVNGTHVSPSVEYVERSAFTSILHLIFGYAKIGALNVIAIF